MFGFCCAIFQSGYEKVPGFVFGSFKRWLSHPPVSLLIEAASKNAAVNYRVRRWRFDVGRVERGSENVTLATLEAFAKALGVPVARLFAEPAPNAPKPPALPPGRKPKASAPATKSPAA